MSEMRAQGTQVAALADGTRMVLLSRGHRSTDVLQVLQVCGEAWRPRAEPCAYGDRGVASPARQEPVLLPDFSGPPKGTGAPQVLRRMAERPWQEKVLQHAQTL